jgi:alcohol dehydrogenase
MAGSVTFGPGCSARVGQKVKELGLERAVVVTDENMEKLGAADRIADLMQEAGVETCVFAGVEPEPSVETTDAVAELAREHDCQAVVALGGGSCMDVGKAVSVLLTNEGSAAKYQGLGLVKNPGVPKIMIPTTAGTGSEVTFTAVLIRKSDGFKGGINDEKLYPDYSFLDPELWRPIRGAPPPPSRIFSPRRPWCGSAGTSGSPPGAGPTWRPGAR